MIATILQRKRLLAEHRAIQSSVEAEGYWSDDPALIERCFAPWEVAAAFGLADNNPSDVIASYELKPICEGHYQLFDYPDDDSWELCVASAAVSIPLYSPYDVWTAVQRRKGEDLGRSFPPGVSTADRLLRLVQRRYYQPWECVPELASQAHDLFVLAAALGDDPSLSLSRLEALAASHGVWHVKDHLPDSGPRGRYLEAYAGTALSEVRQVLGIPNPWRTSEWISPSIIPLIESAQLFQEAVQQTRWLFYKAVTAHKGELPEKEHFQMFLESLRDDPCAKAYFDFLKKQTAAGEGRTPWVDSFPHSTPSALKAASLGSE